MGVYAAHQGTLTKLCNIQVWQMISRTKKRQLDTSEVHSFVVAGCWPTRKHVAVKNNIGYAGDRLKHLFVDQRRQATNTRAQRGTRHA